MPMSPKKTEIAVHGCILGDESADDAGCAHALATDHTAEPCSVTIAFSCFVFDLLFSVSKDRT